MTEHIVPKRTYFLVFGGLLVLTLATTEISFIDLGVFNTVVALVIAAIKASLVVLFFMHARFSSRTVWVAILAAGMWMTILLGLTFADVFSRGWIPPPQGL